MLKKVALIIFASCFICPVSAQESQGKPLSFTPPGWYYAERSSDKKLIIFHFSTDGKPPEVYLTEDIPAIPTSLVDSPAMSEARRIANHAVKRAERQTKKNPLSRIFNAEKKSN